MAEEERDDAASSNERLAITDCFRRENDRVMWTRSVPGVDSSWTTGVYTTVGGVIVLVEDTRSSWTTGRSFLKAGARGGRHRLIPSSSWESQEKQSVILEISDRAGEVDDAPMWLVSTNTGILKLRRIQYSRFSFRVPFHLKITAKNIAEVDGRDGRKERQYPT